MIGILSMQGAIEENEQMIQSLGVQTLRVKKPEHLENLSGLIFPGGESTAMIRLLKFTELVQPLKHCIAKRHMPVLATCAGMILLSRRIENYPDQESLGLLDISLQRNAFGRQIDSFEEGIEIEGLNEPFKAMFIRAPAVTQWGKAVKVLAMHNDFAVMVKQDNIVACSFHPELTSDTRIHQDFLKRVERWENSQDTEAQYS